MPQLPTLAELLALVRERPGTLLNLELKTLGWRDRGLAAAVAAAPRRRGLGDRTWCRASAPWRCCGSVFARPQLRTAYLWVRGSARAVARAPPWPAAWLHVDALHPEHPTVTPERVARWRRRGLTVSTWTVNEPADAARVRAAGVDGIIGDDPDACCVRWERDVGWAAIERHRSSSRPRGGRVGGRCLRIEGRHVEQHRSVRGAARRYLEQLDRDEMVVDVKFTTAAFGTTIEFSALVQTQKTESWS